MTLADLNALDRAGFVEALGWVFEASPWVAERAWERRPFADVDRLHASMAAEVAGATREEQLSLLRAHPDLGTRARMSHASAGEQADAGLNRLAREDVDRLQQLTQSYRDKFGFPFLFAVKGSTSPQVLAALAERLPRSVEEEVAEALRQVACIARFRLDDVLEVGAKCGGAVEQFASGRKPHYYGKGDVVVYRLHRGGQTTGGSPVFGANVSMLTYGEAFWRTYTSGDNTGLVATDSMKNFIQRETINFPGDDLAQYCRFLGSTFLARYRQAEGVQVSATEIPYAGVDGQLAFAPAGPERTMARVELAGERVVEAVAGLRGFKLLRLGGSAFTGFVRDEYTTLPEVTNRPLYMWLDLEWHYTQPEAAFAGDGTIARARQIVRDVFRSFESGSIQQVIYQMGMRMLDELPTLKDVHLEANNRTWDTIAERGDQLGVFTDPRPPYGCLGLRLTR